MLVLVSWLTCPDGQTIQALLDNLGQVVPGSVNKVLEGMADSLEQSCGLAGVPPPPTVPGLPPESVHGPAGPGVGGGDSVTMGVDANGNQPILSHEAPETRRRPEHGRDRHLRQLRQA
jgi:hypothetical protein